MTNIDSLFERLSTAPVDADLRHDILNEIWRCVEIRKDDLGIWERQLFAQSLAYLATNIACSPQPTGLWLRLTLVSLDKAMISKDERSESYTVASEDIDQIDYDFLVQEAEKISLLIRD